MNLIVITPENNFPAEVYLWEALFEAGLQKLHIRKPHSSYSDLQSMIGALPEKYHSRLVLHQHHLLAKELNLGGIHFKSNCHNEDDSIYDIKLTRSRSCHTPLEVLNYYKTHDYVFLSPIFNSISKTGYPSAFYADEMQTFFQDHPEIRNCIALGGINSENINTCLDIGFAGCALLGSIWQGNTISPRIIVKRFQNIQSSLDIRYMPKAISSFQFITNDFSPLNELEQIRQVCKAGANWIQLRLKDKTDEEIMELGKQASEICSQYQACFILNDHVHLVKKIGAQGVHLGKADMAPRQARQLLGPNYIIGGTANNMEDIRKLHQAGVDYIGLGPFRFTNTKKNLAPTLGLQGYSKIIQQSKEENIKLPIVAIGGIEIDHVSELMACELHGIALSSSITQADDPKNTTENYLKHINPQLCKN